MWANVISEHVELKRDHLPISDLLAETASQNAELYKELSLTTQDSAEALHRTSENLVSARLAQRVGLSFAVMQTVIRAHSCYHVFRSDDEYKNYLLKAVLAASEH